MPCSKCHDSREIIDAVEFNVAETPMNMCVHGILDIREMLNNILYVIMPCDNRITLFKFIIMFYMTNNILQNIPHTQFTSRI